MTSPDGPDVFMKSLEFIEKKGVPGAAECRRNNLSLREASKVLWKLYPQGRNAVVDKWIRDVHQFGLKRAGDMDLFLKTLGDGKGDAKLADRANALYLATPRGAVIADLKRPHHWYFYILFSLSIILSFISFGLYVFNTAYPDTVSTDPMTMIIRNVAPPVVWMILKKTVVSTFFSALYSGRHLAIAAASTAKNSKASKVLPYVELSVAVIAIVTCGVLSLYMRTPFLFVAGSLLVVYLLRKKPMVNP